MVQTRRRLRGGTRLPTPDNDEVNKMILHANNLIPLSKGGTMSEPLVDALHAIVRTPQFMIFCAKHAVYMKNPKNKSFHRISPKDYKEWMTSSDEYTRKMNSDFLIRAEEEAKAKRRREGRPMYAANIDLSHIATTFEGRRLQFKTRKPTMNILTDIARHRLGQFKTWLSHQSDTKFYWNPPENNKASSSAVNAVGAPKKFTVSAAEWEARAAAAVSNNSTRKKPVINSRNPISNKNIF